MSAATAVQQIVEVIRVIDAVPAAALPARELEGLVEAIGRLERQLAGRRLEMIADLVQRRARRGDAAGRITRQQLQRDLHLTPGEARRTIDTATALKDLPRTRAALRAGDVSAEHATMIRRAAEDATEQDRRVFDKTGAAVASTTNSHHLRRALEETRQRLLPEDARKREAKQLRQRSLVLINTENGMLAGRFRLPVLHGEAVRTAIEELARPMSSRDDRTLDQRRADALLALATTAQMPANGKRHVDYAPRMSVVVDARLLSADAGPAHGAGGNAHATSGQGSRVSRPTSTTATEARTPVLTEAHEGRDQPPSASGQRTDTRTGSGPTPGPVIAGRLGFGQDISAELARRVGCDADVARVVLGAEGDVLEVGRARRTATSAQRRALEVRDRACIGCSAPPGRCQAHHIIWWRNGGRTDIDNLVLVCWSCHDKVHHLGWSVHRQPSGRYELQPPDRGGLSDAA